MAYTTDATVLRVPLNLERISYDDDGKDLIIYLKLRKHLSLNLLQASIV